MLPLEKDGYLRDSWADVYSLRSCCIVQPGMRFHAVCVAVLQVMGMARQEEGGDMKVETIGWLSAKGYGIVKGTKARKRTAARLWAVRKRLIEAERLGCGLFYHRWHDKAKTIRNYVPPPSRETCPV